jgi:hypothetical protein
VQYNYNINIGMSINSSQQEVKSKIYQSIILI